MSFVVVWSLSHVRHSGTPMGPAPTRLLYWCGVLFPSPGALCTPQLFEHCSISFWFVHRYSQLIINFGFWKRLSNSTKKGHSEVLLSPPAVFHRSAPPSVFIFTQEVASCKYFSELRFFLLIYPKQSIPLYVVVVLFPVCTDNGFFSESWSSR